jgi:hypothetical protein
MKCQLHVLVTSFWLSKGSCTNKNDFHNIYKLLPNVVITIIVSIISTPISICLNINSYMGSLWIIPIQSVPITTKTLKVVSLNPAHGEVYSIQHYVIMFVSDLRHVGDFLRVLWFTLPIKLTAKI